MWKIDPVKLYAARDEVCPEKRGHRLWKDVLLLIFSVMSITNEKLAPLYQGGD